jgi:hypothetical protein
LMTGLSAGEQPQSDVSVKEWMQRLEEREQQNQKELSQRLRQDRAALAKLHTVVLRRLGEMLRAVETDADQMERRLARSLQHRLHALQLTEQWEALEPRLWEDSFVDPEFLLSPKKTNGGTGAHLLLEASVEQTQTKEDEAEEEEKKSKSKSKSKSKITTAKKKAPAERKAMEQQEDGENSEDGGRAEGTEDREATKATVDEDEEDLLSAAASSTADLMPMVYILDKQLEVHSDDEEEEEEELELELEQDEEGEDDVEAERNQPEPKHATDDDEQSLAEVDEEVDGEEEEEEEEALPSGSSGKAVNPYGSLVQIETGTAEIEREMSFVSTEDRSQPDEAELAHVDEEEEEDVDVDVDDNDKDDEDEDDKHKQRRVDRRTGPQRRPRMDDPVLEADAPQSSDADDGLEHDDGPAENILLPDYTETEVHLLDEEGQLADDQDE